MWSFLVVVVKPAHQVLGALGAAAIEPAVGPLAQHGLDEAFGLAVGLWRVGACTLVMQPCAAARLTKPVRSIAGAVICEQVLDGDALSSEPGTGATHEGRASRAPFIGQDLGVGDAGEVVDGNVDEFPTRAVALPGATA